MKTDALSKSGSSQPAKQKAELQELLERAESLALQAKSESTKRAYKKDFELFASWTSKNSLDHLPALPETVTLYITHMDKIGRAPSTIKRVLAAISQAHKLCGLESPTSSAQVSEVIKGIRRKRGTAQRQAKPLLASELRKIINVISPDVVGIRDKALLLVGWAGALRRSELVALNVDDIDQVEEGIVLTIRRSKGDQEGAGQKVAIPALDNEFCPVKALFKWLGLSKIKSGPVFCSVGFGGKNRFFTDITNEKRLGGQTVALRVKKYVKMIGYDPDQYSAHSLRAGWTTSAAAINAPDHVMMRHTRHKSLKTLLGYVRGGQLFTDNPLPLLLAT